MHPSQSFSFFLRVYYKFKCLLHERDLFNKTIEKMGFKRLVFFKMQKGPVGEEPRKEELLPHETALAILKSSAPQLRVILAPQQEYCRILIDGYYGEHSDMSSSTLEQMSKKALDLIQNHWKIPWNHIIWICAASTWMKSLPLILMQQGYGHAIEFYFPCHWRLLKGPKDTGPNKERLVFYGREGQTITRSMDLMQKRLAEGKSGAQCEIPHLSTQIKDCIMDMGDRASMFFCDGFVEQRKILSRASTHMLYFPHITPTINASNVMSSTITPNAPTDPATTATAPSGLVGSSGHIDPNLPPSKIDSEAYFNQGGKSFEEKPPNRRLRVNIYEELRTCNLQGRTLVL
jgi:hypothetical protein